MTIDTPAIGPGTSTNSNALDVRCPADGHLVRIIPIDDVAVVHAVAKELRSAQPEWQALGPDGRKRHMMRFMEWLLDNQQHLVEVMQAAV